ncbi:hypothetical protein [Nocardioides albus]|uniref:Type II secretory pathway pseudopilin PulG n=1 Tax=Nocardioides albus TaxID=1841 RepID=A0A7W5F7K2_9ACTN|nr:hypothetical protein [Nocardioides albus]MBB3088239.1 type II secretory pathway pseudopilin PulG [Nocardioides albus]GGU42851.1 hypothetical protein GCM10007979_47670 [Nocardioides albus]
MSTGPEGPNWNDQLDWSAHPTYAAPTPTSESPRPRWPWVLGAVVAVVLSLVALLGAGLLLSYRAEQADAARENAAEAKAIETCRAEIGEFVEAVLDASSRAEVGIVQADLSEAISDAAVLGNRIDASSLSPECDSAYQAADEAQTIYALSASTWEDCIWEYTCDPDTDFDNSDWSTAQDKAQAAYDAMLAGISVDAVNS